MPELVPTAIATPELASHAKDALRMEEKGMPAGLIFDASHIVRAPGQYMDYVTDDQSSVEDMAKLQQAILQKDANPTIKEYLSFPELYRLVPDIANTTVEDNTKNLKDLNAYAAYEPGFNNIGLRGDLAHGNYVSALIPHELQHALDYKAINNPTMQKEFDTGNAFDENSLESLAERRAYLIEAADRLQHPDVAKQAIFDVMSKGIPANSSKAEEALLKAAATHMYLNTKSTAPKKK